MVKHGSKIIFPNTVNTRQLINRNWSAAFANKAETSSERQCKVVEYGHMFMQIVSLQRFADLNAVKSPGREGGHGRFDRSENERLLECARTHILRPAVQDRWRIQLSGLKPQRGIFATEMTESPAATRVPSSTNEETHFLWERRLQPLGLAVLNAPPPGPVQIATEGAIGVRWGITGEEMHFASRL
jgi:hypothetical protein